MRSIATLTLLLLPLAAATSPGFEDGSVAQPREGMWHDPDIGSPYLGIQSLRWHAAENGTHIQWIGTPAELRIMVFGGSAGDPEPDDWILIHIGNETRAYDATGPIAVQALNQSAVMLRPIHGSCVFPVAEVLEWDHGYTVIDAVPDGSSLAWDEGLLCGQGPVPQLEENATKKSPLPLAWVVAALVVAKRKGRAPSGI